MRGAAFRGEHTLVLSFLAGGLIASCGFASSPSPTGVLKVGVSSHYEVPSSTPFALVRMDQGRLVEVDGKQMLSVVSYGDKATISERCAAAAARGHWVEVWNEPNLREFWGEEPDPARYVELVKECRAAAPGATLLGPGIGGAAWDWAYLEAVKEITRYVNIVTVHAYASSPESLGEDISRVRGIMGTYRVGISEWGFPGSDPGSIRRALEAAELAKVEFLVLYSWRDDPEGGGFGLVEHDGASRPGYAAVLDYMGE